MEVRFTDQETQAWEGGAHHPLGPRPGAPLAASTWPLTQVLVPEPAGLKGGSGCQPLPARLRGPQATAQRQSHPGQPHAAAPPPRRCFACSGKWGSCDDSPRGVKHLLLGLHRESLLVTGIPVSQCPYSTNRKHGPGLWSGVPASCPERGSKPAEPAGPPSDCVGRPVAHLLCGAGCLFSPQFNRNFWPSVHFILLISFY